MFKLKSQSIHVEASVVSSFYLFFCAWLVNHLHIRRRLFIRLKAIYHFITTTKLRKKTASKKSNNENSNNQRHVSTNNTWKLLGACCEKHQPKTVCQIKSTFPVFSVRPSKKRTEKYGRKFKNHFSFSPSS